VEHKLFIDGRWVDGGLPLEVRNKYTGEIVGAVPNARPQDVDAAIAAATRAATAMADMPAHRRSDILLRVASLILERREDLAHAIAVEAGKAIKFARAEVDRAHTTFTIAAEEAKRLNGETVSLDTTQSGEGYFGFWVRRPVGVVAAISPFNFPLNLAVHKVAPAIASGNAVVLKPASSTPLIAVKLCEILEAAGIPAGAVNLLVGPGSSVGEQLVTDPRVDKVTFTGSRPVGERILAAAGIKKVTLELGNTSPVVVAPDADLDLAARRCAFGAFVNSGQVCVSVQRIYVHKQVYDAFVEKFVNLSRAMVVGDPLDEHVDIGPMIDVREAERIETWVDEARANGAQVLTGGKREGPVYHPTVLVHVSPTMKVVAEEAFAPVVSVFCCDDFEESLRQADDTKYGLQVAVFTRDIDRVFRAVKRLNFGGVIINEAPTFRADHTPYGGNRLSGLGREGVRFAMEEMTNIQMVVIKLTS
jgi:acyl-CoA reductase-like NAD-dependent aldehyde dehydrogenase